MTLSTAARILVVDDAPSVCSLIGRALQSHEMDCALVTEATRVEQLLHEEQFGAILCDVNMPEVSGLEILQIVMRQQPNTPVVLMTGQGSVEDAKYAIRQGAYDYLEKPLEIDNLCQIIQQAMSTRKADAAVATENGAGDQRDVLTGLITPRVLHERLMDIRLASVADRRQCSVVVVDVDDFAEANSIFGYAFGDVLLRRLADGLQDALGAATPICRFGSDEFVIVLIGMDERQALEQAELVCQMVNALSLQWQRHSISISVSIGAAEAGGGFSMPPEQLLANARRALREAKRNNGATCVGYSQVAEGAGGAVQMVTAELHTMAQEASKINHQLWLACLESVRALVSAVEAKDPYTRRHSDQVAYYAEHLAKFADLGGDIIEKIRVAAMVHDVGKIGIPDTVLTKPGALTDSELELVRAHPKMGADILSKISLLATERKLVLHHHENWDGSGYPDGIAGEEIPIGARVIQLADSIDAMLMRRTYKAPFTLSHLLRELERCRGTQFDPDLTDAAIQWCAANAEKMIQPTESDDV